MAPLQFAPAPAQPRSRALAPQRLASPHQACRQLVAACRAAPRRPRRSHGPGQVSAVWSGPADSTSYSSSDDSLLGRSDDEDSQPPRFLSWLASQADEERLINSVTNVGVLAFGSAAVVAHIATHDSSAWDLYQQAVTTNPVATKVSLSARRRAGAAADKPVPGGG